MSASVAEALARPVVRQLAARLVPSGAAGSSAWAPPTPATGAKSEVTSGSGTSKKLTVTGEVTVGNDVIVAADIYEVDLTGAAFNGGRLRFANSSRSASSLRIHGGQFFNVNYPINQQGAWCIGPFQDQPTGVDFNYGDISLENMWFYNCQAQAFHAFGGNQAGAYRNFFGNLTFTDINFFNMGRETFYVKGPRVGNITSRRVRKLDTSLTGWDTDHTAFAGDAMDFNNADAGVSWDKVILVEDCDLRFLEGAGLVAGAQTVIINNSNFDECWDSAPGAAMVYPIWFSPQGPAPTLTINSSTISSWRSGGVLNINGNGAYAGTGSVTVNTSIIRANGDPVATLGRIPVTIDGTTSVLPYTGGNPKLHVRGLVTTVGGNAITLANGSVLVPVW